MIHDSMEICPLKPAKERGAQIISGIETLVHQVRGSVEIWTGKPAPKDGRTKVGVLALQERRRRRGGLQSEQRRRRIS